VAYQWSLEPAVLTELASGALGRIVEIRKRTDLGPLQALQDECLQLFATFDEHWRHARAPADPQIAGDSAKYALVCLLDEIVADADWVHRRAWESRSLELQLFGSDRRGKEFYQRLDKLVKSPDALPAVLLAYYTCLLAGFRGQHLHDEVARTRIIEEVRERLAAPERVDFHDLAPPIKTTDKSAISQFTDLSRPIRWASVAVIVLLGVIYVVFQWNLLGAA
jgi:type IV/VI secretion system ImpK/VasF family protein